MPGIFWIFWKGMSETRRPRIALEEEVEEVGGPAAGLLRKKLGERGPVCRR